MNRTPIKTMMRTRGALIAGRPTRERVSPARLKRVQAQQANDDEDQACTLTLVRTREAASVCAGPPTGQTRMQGSRANTEHEEER